VLRPTGSRTVDQGPGRTKNSSPKAQGLRAFSKRKLYAALGAVGHAVDAGAIGGELTRIVPRLRIGELPGHLASVDPEIAKRLIDRLFLWQRRAIQLAD